MPVAMTWWMWLLVPLIPTILLALMMVSLCRVSAQADRRSEIVYARARARSGQPDRGR